MYKITNATKREAVKAAYTASVRHITNRVTFGHYTTVLGVRSFVSDGVIITEGLKDLSVSQALGSDGDATIGSVGSSSYSATFDNPSASFNYRDKIAFVESGIQLADGTYYYTPCGYFATEKPETDDDGKTLTVSGYDEIDKMGGKWAPSITVSDTTTLKDIVENIASMHGLSVAYVDTTAQNALKNHVIGVATAAELTDQSERDVLGYCVGCAGMSARINTVGKLYISWFFSPGTTYDYTITADAQWENGFVKTTESAVKIEAITAGVDEDVYTKGTGVPLSFVNPIITHAEIDAIYTRYNGRTWYPSTCTWRGNPCIEVGDIVTVKDKNNKTYTVYIVQQELDMSGGLKSDIVSPGLDTEDMSFDSVSASTRLELNKVLNSMESAIKAATDAINGANGGYYRVLDLDKDGNPDGWECFATDGLKGVRCTYGGIGCTTDGGQTYTNAMTGNGINATAITTGIITGGTGQFSFNLDTGHISASDVDITGGDINLDGGQLSIENSGFKTDLSSGYLQMYYTTNMQTGANYEYFDINNTLIGTKFYATLAALKPAAALGVTSNGFRFGEKAENATLVNHWNTDYAVIEKDNARFRTKVEVNEPLSVAAGGDAIGFIAHAPNGANDVSAELGATSDASALLQIVNNTKGTIPARIEIYSSGTNGKGMTLKLTSGGGYTGRLFLDTTGLYAEFNDNGDYKKLA